MAELEDGYILYASLSWTDPNLPSVPIINPEPVDANGQAASLGDEMPGFMPDAGAMTTNFAYRIFGKKQCLAGQTDFGCRCGYPDIGIVPAGPELAAAAQ